ncbi:hypothetical protein [Vannielia litorea]|nr:hypothetical protein [Vannielia litorea]
MIHFLRRLFPTQPKPDPEDPFTHPAVRTMSARELADLPLPRPTR